MKIFSDHPQERNLDEVFESDQSRSDLPRRRWRSLWITSSIFVTGAIAIGIVTAAFQFGLPWWMQAGDHNHVYESDIGSLRYQVHLPPQFDGTIKLPVIMAIHGCGMTGYGWNSMKSTTQFNRLADSEGFIVVYPTQRMFRNMINCWNSTDPREQHRYSGEPALLAGVAQQVVEAYNADPAQVHVAGASSGAGAAVILAVTYPDVFATVLSEQGKHSYTHTTITAPDGSSLIESYLVQDMGHVWPGPAGDGIYIDHAGPDASAIIWNFAKRHPKS